MKVTIVYWSGTGNTERMAEAIAEGARAAGAETELLPVSGADASVTESDVLLFGCPAMGCETLEEGEFEPFFSAIEGALAGKRWGFSVLMIGETGNGCVPGMPVHRADGAEMLAEGLIVNNAPGGEDLEKCRALGALAAKAGA